MKPIFITPAIVAVCLTGLATMMSLARAETFTLACTPSEWSVHMEGHDNPWMQPVNIASFNFVNLDPTNLWPCYGDLRNH
jgi:hypothetical protein